MSTLVTVMLLAWMAGLAGFGGGLVARLEHFAERELKQEFVHGIVALGGGILVAAVAFTLAPKGIEHLAPHTLALLALAGGVSFCVLDEQVSRRTGARAQEMAMMMDFIPEALALGAVFVYDPKMGLLLALLVTAQNITEGFNTYRELRGSGSSPRRVLATLFVMSFIGPIAALAGYLLLQDAPQITASVTTFAAGGILYLVFEDIAPQSTMKRHWAPPLGSVVGFTIGMVGSQLLG